MNLQAQPIKTSILHRNDDLIQFLLKHLQGIDLENKVLAITSKIVSISENRLVPADSISKNDLVKKEADHYLGEGGYGVELTIKHGILIPSAGIDESNSENGDYILYPLDPYASAKKIWQALKTELGLKNFGILITDSHTIPLRLGVMGIALAHWGFKATRSYVDQPDIFGRKLKFTHIDVADGLAAAAVLVMGEGTEQQPMAVVGGFDLEFTQNSSPDEVAIPLKDDLYYPILKPLIRAD